MARLRSRRHPLQNHCGTLRLPVTWNLIGFRSLGMLAGQGLLAYGVIAGLAAIMVYGAITTVPTLVKGFVDLLRDPVGAAQSMTWNDWKAMFIALVLPALWLMAFPAGLVLTLNQAKREQQLYYKLHGHGRPTDDERRLLRIGASWAYVKGGLWPITLELWPMARGIAPRKLKRFRTFELASPDHDRDHLATEWGILDRRSLERRLESIYAEGVHSLSFAVLVDAHADAFVERLAAFAGVDTEDVLECVDDSGARPQPLLWGYDLIRAHHIVRAGYSAGYLERDAACAHLARITDYVTTLFESEETFLTNTLLGYAVWLHEDEYRGAVAERGRANERFLVSDWPTQLGPWPSPREHALTSAMVTGFREQREQARRAHGELGEERSM